MLLGLYFLPLQFGPPRTCAALLGEVRTGAVAPATVNAAANAMRIAAVATQ